MSEPFAPDPVNTGVGMVTNLVHPDLLPDRIVSEPEVEEIIHDSSSLFAERISCDYQPQ